MILGGLIGLELRGAALSPAGEGGSVRSKAHALTAAESSPSEGNATWVKEVLARPLFNPTRTPPAAPVTAVGTVAALPRLAGIMISPAEKEAVFMPAKGQPIVAKEGGAVGVFTVRLITADTVVVSGPHGFTVLHTAFTTSTAPDAAAPPPPSPFSVFGGISGTPGAAWLKTGNGKIDLPSAATWSGPPPLSRLPVSRPAPSGSPLLTPAGPQG